MSSKRYLISTLCIIVCLLLTSCTKPEASKGFWNELQPKQGVYFGLFRQGINENLGFADTFESKYGKHVGIVMWYLDWNQEFPLTQCKDILARGSVPHIVWEPWFWGVEGKVTFDDILAGKWDAYITKWAKGVKSFNAPIFIRFAHEFNIEGYPWCIVNIGRDPDKYIKTFRYVHDLYTKAGATNALWVWCPMNFSFPESSWNNYVLAYPGDKYVDWIGIDGYNWGTTQSWSQWQSFEDLFREPVSILSRNFPTKPIMIAEFGSANDGGEKAEFFSRIAKYCQTSLKQIRAVLYFDVLKETDWRIETTPKTAEAFKTMMADPYILNDAVGIGVAKAIPPKSMQKKTMYIVPASTAIKIDGNLNEWDKAGFVMLDSLVNVETGPNWQGKGDLSGKVALLWSPTALYIAAKVWDDLPNVNFYNNADLWNGDAVEIALSVDPTADPKRGQYQNGDYQIGFGTGDGKKIKPAIWCWQLNGAPKGSQIKTAKMPGGYTLEAMLPWASLGEIIPKAGIKLGFNFALDDADTKLREVQMLWNGDYLFYKDPSVWGWAEFK